MSEIEPIHLAAGPLSLALSPCSGGSITGMWWADGARRVPLMRESHSGATKVTDLACFPLVPFVNRIRDGRFVFRGREVVLSPNMAGDISPLHGQGWLADWAVEQQDGASVTLAFEHPAGEWPWRYRATQRVELNELGLSIRLTCRNEDDQPMPCGLGLHPYFPCGLDTRIDTTVRTVFTIDEHVLPVDEEPAVGRFDLSRRLVCGQGLDHGFGGWSGDAILSDPAWPAALRLSSPQARFFQLYSPPTGGIFVAEPVTHANAALNEPEDRWAELGLRVLEPGEEMQLDMRLELVSE